MRLLQALARASKSLVGMSGVRTSSDPEEGNTQLQDSQGEASGVRPVTIDLWAGSPLTPEDLREHDAAREVWVCPICKRPVNGRFVDEQVLCNNCLVTNMVGMIDHYNRLNSLGIRV